jgi:branched-chain amino acid transport system substrate-binding protein
VKLVDTWNIPVSDAPAMLDIRKYVLDPKKTEIEEGQFDWVFYQRGVLISMFTVEAIRNAQEHFNTRFIDAGQLRWGFENLDIGEARLARIGMTGMIAPFATSCSDHSGNGGAWMLEWDGRQFVPVSALLHADRAAVTSLVMTEADKYAEAHPPWTMNDGCN